MAIATVTEVMTNAAGLLGDPSQEQFTGPVLLPFFSKAYREAYDLAQRLGLQVAERDAFAVLPANTTVLIPSAFGITDLGEPIALWERSGVTTKTITGATNATPIVITAASHGLSSNQQVEIYGVVGPIGINQRWRVTVLTSSTFSLNGSVAGGAYSSGGTLVIGGEESSNPFRLMGPADELSMAPLDDRLNSWKWMNDAFYFNGKASATEIRINYRASGTAPQSGSVGWDNAQSFLETRTASLAAAPYDMPDLAESYKFDALGPSGQADGTGGLLRGFMLPMLKEKFKRPKRPQPFRPRMNSY